MANYPGTNHQNTSIPLIDYFGIDNQNLSADQVGFKAVWPLRQTKITIVQDRQWGQKTAFTYL